MNGKRFGFKLVTSGKAVVFFVVFAVLLLLTGIIIHQSAGKTFFYKPVGYIKKVQELVDEGVIKYNKDTGKIGIDEKYKSKEVEDFYHRSYLKEDIDAFNDGYYSGTFNIKGGEIHLDIRARQIKLPYTTIRQWTGELFYRNRGISAILENDHLHLQIIPAQRNLLPLRADYYEMVPVRKEGFYSRYGYLLTYDNRRYFAQIEYIGDNVVLGMKERSPYLSVNNYKIPVGNNVRLEDGDIICFYKGNYRDYFVFKEKGSAGTISNCRNVNGNWQRVYFSKNFPFARHFCQGLQGIVANQPSREKEEKFDVTLTLDRELHQTIQEELVDFIIKKDGRRNLKYFPAAVTLMDIDTGDLLALASYPDPVSLQTLERKLTLQDKKFKRRLRRLRLNQNLLLHPIGSAVKPMLASAIWSVHPYLSEYKIIDHPPGKKLDETLGLSFEEPFEIFGHPGNITDRRAFFKYSCNLYMVNLLFLGIASDHNGSITFTTERIPPDNAVGNSIIYFGVDFSHYLDKKSNIFLNLESSPIATSLRDLFDIETEMIGSNDVMENTASRYDTGLMEPIARKMLLQEKTELRPMYSACPEQVNLRFNQVQLLRSEFISMDFGGASAEWSNIKLAESLSRIVSGKRVKAKLIIGAEEEEGEVNLSKINLGFDSYNEKVNDALQWVREGLLMVTERGGTAATLADDISSINNTLQEKKLRVVVLSKTGSPRKHDDEGSPNGAVYIFSILLEKRRDTGWEKVNGVTGAVYIEDRGKGTLAVRFTKQVFKHIVHYLENKYKMQL